jgi:hypothetical protein
MGLSTFAFTDAQAMAIALAMANGQTPDDAITSVMGESRRDSHTVENLARKFSHKVHVAERAKAKPAGKSKARIANENIANSFFDTLDAGEEFNLYDLMMANPSVTTYSKAAAIVDVMVELKMVTRNGSRNGKTIYKVA